MCIRKYDDGLYSQMEFLRAISHFVEHTNVLRLDNTTASDTDDDIARDEASPSEDDNTATETCEVCLLQPRSAVAFVPWGHSRFCGACADAVAALDSWCPLCRCPIRMVHRLYNQCTVCELPAYFVSSSWDHWGFYRAMLAQSAVMRQ